VSDGGRVLNKGDFGQVLAERTDLSKAAATRALDGILETLTEAMVERDEVSFTGWGKFNAQRRKGREAQLSQRGLRAGRWI
jgi:nucleoid DNA-binding protein